MGIGTSAPLATLSVQGVAGSGDAFTVASSSGANFLTVTATGNTGLGTTTRPKVSCGWLFYHHLFNFRNSKEQ